MEQKEIQPCDDGYHAVTPDPLLQLATRIVKGTLSSEEKIIKDHAMLVQLVTHLRDMGCVIVFTTGVWDLYHLGHGIYIRKGKEAGREFFPQADHVVVVVGVDTDALTRERKGPKRPIVGEDERLMSIAELAPAADIVTPQYEANQLYKLIPHDVRVISTSTSDLTDEMRDIMQKQCAHIVNLPPQAETSTSARVRTLIIDGRLEAVSRFKDRLAAFLEEIEHELSE